MASGTIKHLNFDGVVKTLYLRAPALESTASQILISIPAYPFVQLNSAMRCA